MYVKRKPEKRSNRSNEDSALETNKKVQLKQNMNGQFDLQTGRNEKQTVQLLLIELFYS